MSGFFFFVVAERDRALHPEFHGGIRTKGKGCVAARGLEPRRGGERFGVIHLHLGRWWRRWGGFRRSTRRETQPENERVSTPMQCLPDHHGAVRASCIRREYRLRRELASGLHPSITAPHYLTAMILESSPLGFPWVTQDPFLFCVHHDDAYPAGNDAMGPAASLAGRRIGMDFEIKDGWRMYHGDVVPGFPRHPHRGFETVTIARRGFIDHADSLGATARFGHGDVQWMTAGQGIVHSEMFPLVNRDSPNPTELFQIWLNLPRADKMVEPYFTMLWGETIPVVEPDAGVRVRVVAGALQNNPAPPPPPNSWASRAEADVAIWTATLAPRAEWTLPPAQDGTRRTVYFFAGESLSVGGEPQRPSAMQVATDREVLLTNGDTPSEVLVLQGRPIGEPVSHYGPFGMNTPREIQQAMADYRRTEFGGWPWPSDGPVHDRKAERFAVHADGTREEPAAPKTHPEGVSPAPG